MNKLPAILVLIATALPVALSAAVPLRWTVETSRVQPAQFEAYHGETLELAATMQSYGKPLAITNDMIGIYWQTNGMGSAYWTAPAVLSNNVMTARWTPSMDVGANVYSCFIGAPGEIYRAAFQLRLRPSPGAVPSELPLPVKTLDFAQVTVLNAPYYSKSETDARIIELAPAPGNYETVSNRAMTAVQPTAISDMETQTHAAATYQPKGPYLTSEADPTVYPWAKATTKPSYTWTEIGSKPTTFAPSAHSHAKSDVTGLTAELAGKRGMTDLSYARTSWKWDDEWIFPDGYQIPESWGDGWYTETYTDHYGIYGFAIFLADETYIGGGNVDYTEEHFVACSQVDGDPAYGPFPETASKNETEVTTTDTLTLTSDIRAALSDKQDVIADLNIIRSGAALGATALQSYTETDPTISAWAKAATKPSYTWTEIGSKPTTIVGYGITDAYTIAQVDNALNAKSDKFDVNGVAPDNGNVDVKEIYNSNKTQKIDGNGDVYVGEVNTGGSWRHTNGAVMSYNNNSGAMYTWRTVDGRQSVSYNSENGKVTVTGNYYGTIRAGLNPLNGDDLGAVTSGVNVVTFTKQQTQFPDEPTTRLAKLNDIPTALKCPNALTINVNGALEATYDGGSAKTVNITTGGDPGATVASAALEYHADGQAISVSVAASGTLTAVVNSWTDGQSQMAFVTLAAGASIAPAIKLIGYSEWPIGEEFMAVCTKRGSKIYVNPVCVTEE